MDQKFIRSVQIDWNQIDRSSYLRKIPALQNLTELVFHQPVTFFVGENGTGKSTLLEAIAVASGYNAEGGTRNYHFQTYDDVSELSDALSLTRGYRRPKSGYFFRAESFFNVATMLVDEYEGADYHAVSHGESFLAFLQHANTNGLYLMDEPEAALSPQRQLTLLTQIAQLAKGGAQFLIVTHSPILLGLPDAEILCFDGDAIHPCAWEDTDSYRITKLFLENRSLMLHRLLDE